MRRSLLFTSLLLCLSAQAAEPSKSSYVLKAARLFDAKAGRLVTPGVVVVVDGKVTAVGAGASVPAGAKVVELGDATLLPGFMDSHTHLTGEAGHDWRQDVIDDMQRS